MNIIASIPIASKRYLLGYFWMIIAVFLAFNKIAIAKQTWSVYETQGFSIYHQTEDSSLAHEAGEILESEFNRVTDLLGYIPARKTIIYLITDNSSDLRVPRPDANHAVKVEPGKLKEDLLFTWTGILLEEMFGSRTIKKFPDWYSKGIMAYLAGMEIQKNKIEPSFFDPQNLPKLDMNKSLITGELIWEYLVKTNGKGIIAPILNISRINKGTNDAIEEVTDLSFENLLNACAKYYLQS